VLLSIEVAMALAASFQLASTCCPLRLVLAEDVVVVEANTDALILVSEAA
jgi:hypothetical protein